MKKKITIMHLFFIITIMLTSCTDIEDFISVSEAKELVMQLHSNSSGGGEGNRTRVKEESNYMAEYKFLWLL